MISTNDTLIVTGIVHECLWQTRSAPKLSLTEPEWISLGDCHAPARGPGGQASSATMTSNLTFFFHDTKLYGLVYHYNCLTLKAEYVEHKWPCNAAKGTKALLRQMFRLMKLPLFSCMRFETTAQRKDNCRAGIHSNKMTLTLSPSGPKNG